MAERPDFRAPKGTQDVLPPESARWEALLATFAQVAGRYGYGLIQSPMFEDIGVFQRIGEGTDVVAKEMYDFEDKGGRRVALRPGGHRAGGAGLRRAPPRRAVEGLVRHAGVPLRAAAGRPLPPAPPGGRRVHRLGRPRRRRRGDRPRARLPVRARACGSGAWSSTSWARPPTGRPTPRVLQDVAARPGRRPRRPTTPPRSSRTRCGCSTRSAPRRGPCSPTRRAWSTTSTRRRWPTASGCRRGCELLGIDVRGRRDARPRPRLLHAHALRVPELGARATPSRRSSAAAATTASSSSSAARPRPASASAAASSGCCSRCDAEGVFAGAASRGSTASSSTSPAARSPRRCASVLRDGRRGRPTAPSTAGA